MRLAVVLVAALMLAPAATAADTRLTEEAATAAFLNNPKVGDWLDRYPTRDRIEDASFDRKTGAWTVHVWSGKAGEIATGRVDDASGRVTEALTGPQVAWKMARGKPGAFGGRSINRPAVWLGLDRFGFRRGPAHHLHARVGVRQF